nr:P-loop NTPase fold protein [uncultured Psychroserpens sp.]
MAESLNFIGDNPIEKIEDDLFNFEHYALKVQKLIQHNSNNSNPLTIGVYGKWGEGKTSFLNLIENKIDLWEKDNKSDKGILKYHFNPWRYSSENEMLFDFFDGLAKSMFVEKNRKLKKVGEGIIRVSKYLKAVKLSASVGLSEVNKLSASINVGDIFETLGGDLKGEELTLEILKNKVNKALSEANYKIIVFIDDLDRLDKDEIFTILKLIKLNGSFDNFIYLVTLDSEQVAKAISQRYGTDTNDGKLFLEKIINIPIHLPRIEEEDLQLFFEAKFNTFSKQLLINFQTEKKQELELVIYEFQGKFFKTPREILKVLNSFLIGAYAIGDEVNLRDLFWIESLKVKDQEFYDFLKNIEMNNFQYLNTSIDFNDNVTQNTEIINGSRKFISEKFEESFQLFELLFPSNKGGFPLNEKIDTNALDREQKINSVLHYDKYFTYHAFRKVSNVNLKLIKKKIVENDKEDLKELFKSFFKQKPEHRAYYKFEDFLKNISVEEGRDFLFEYVLDNLQLFPDFGKDLIGVNSLMRLIEDVSKLLIEDKKMDSVLILKLANKLNTNQLCYFIRSFKEDQPIKEKLEKLIVEKKEFIIEGEPFFYNASNMPNKMIMSYWKKYKPLEFKEKIETSLKDIESTSLFIRNFPGFWNGEYFGGLTKNNYNYMKSLIDVNIVFNKLVEFDKQLVDEVEIESYKFNDMDKSEVKDNVKQFVFWYKKDSKEQFDILKV